MKTLELARDDHLVLDPVEAGLVPQNVRAAVARSVEMRPNVDENGTTDVFVSYKRRLRPQVQQLVNLWRLFKINVRFDADFEAGDSYMAEIGDEIRRAKCVVVFWTEDCFRHGGDTSNFVLGEAMLALERGVLVPVFVEPVSLDPPWNTLHTQDMTAWFSGTQPTAEGVESCLAMVAAIADKIGRPGLVPYLRASAHNTADELEDWARAYPDDPLVESAHARARALRAQHLLASASPAELTPDPMPRATEHLDDKATLRERHEAGRKSVPGAWLVTVQACLAAACVVGVTLIGAWTISSGFRKDAQNFLEGASMQFQSTVRANEAVAPLRRIGS